MKNTRKVVIHVVTLILALLFCGVAQADVTDTKTGTAALGSESALGQGNVADGYSALTLNTDGSFNTGIGFEALFANTIGINNTATGSTALLLNTNGNYNSAFGVNALHSNTSGVDNTGVGSSALYSNSTGQFNTSVGVNSLYVNVSGSYNTAIGMESLANNTAYYNTAVGESSLYKNTSGTDNTAVGSESLFANTTGSDNTALGIDALADNTTGQQNLAAGSEALENNTTGYNNTASGFLSLQLNTTGYYNSAIGHKALQANTTGYGNTAEGYHALVANTTGHGNIAIGSTAGGSITTGSNNIEIGNSGVSGDTGTMRLGSQTVQTKTFVAGIYNVTVTGGMPVYVLSNGQLGSLPSSAKFKQNIRDMGHDSDALMALRPVTFQYKSAIDPTGLPQFGLVAEEVEKVSPDLVVHDADHQIQGVRYEAVNAMLLNEVQKQHEINAEQEKTIADQQKQLQTLTARLDQVEQAQAKSR